MARITVGLDFGTHQTKLCIEDKADINNPIYSFFPFEDLEGKKNIILPSIIQINKDNTLSYGFVDKEGNEVIPFMFSQVYDFHNGLVYAHIEENWVSGDYYNKSGEKVTPKFF